MAGPNGGWEQWSKYVLKELERLNKCYDTLDKSVQKVHTEIAMLKVKSGIWGAIGASIPIGLGLAIWYIQQK